MVPHILKSMLSVNAAFICRFVCLKRDGPDNLAGSQKRGFSSADVFLEPMKSFSPLTDQDGFSLTFIEHSFGLAVDNRRKRLES